MFPNDWSVFSRCPRLSIEIFASPRACRCFTIPVLINPVPPMIRTFMACDDSGESVGRVPPAAERQAGAEARALAAVSEVKESRLAVAVARARDHDDLH